jgi:hypothetical protein
LGCASHPLPPFNTPNSGIITISATPQDTTISFQTSGQFLPSQTTTINENSFVYNCSDGSVPYNIKSEQAGPTPNNLFFTSKNLTSTQTNMTISSDQTGTGTTPLLTLTNTAGGAGAVGMEIYKNKSTVGASGDIIFSQQFNAKDYTGTKTTFGKIESVITGSSVGTGNDGALDFYTAVNGVNSLVMRMNGADNENNSFRPLDMNGNAVRTSTGSLAIDTASSTGVGAITITPKAGQALTIPSSADATNDYIRINPQTTANTQQLLMTATDTGTNFANSINLLNLQNRPYIELKADFGGAINKSLQIDINGAGSTNNSITAYDGQTNLPFQIIANNPTGNGSIELVCDTNTSAGGDLIFTGTNIESGTSGGNSGQHLRIKLNGVYYKIALLVD